MYEKEEDILKELFDRFAPEILILRCDPRRCSALFRSLKVEKLPAVLPFSEGRLMGCITDPNDEVF